MPGGVFGTERTVVLRALLLPQAFTAFTVSEPDINAAPKFTVTEVVPCPDAIVAFDGAVHK
jgi:hypothetical protein